MSDGALKPEKDFSKETAKVIGEAEELAKVSSAASASENQRGTVGNLPRLQQC